MPLSDRDAPHLVHEVRSSAFGRTAKSRSAVVQPNTMRRFVAVAAPLLAAGCTIIIKPNTGGGGDLPVPIPLACAPDNGAPTAHVIFTMRVEKTTVNLAEHYGQFMVNTTLMLAGAGLQATSAVLLRADERPVQTEVMGAWGCGVGDLPDVLPPTSVIRHYALNEPLEPSPLGCATDTVLAAGAALGDVVTRYPPSLNGMDNKRPFTNAPDVLLVVHIDGLPRRTGADDTECASANDLATTIGVDAGWAQYRDGGIDMSHVVHWFVATDEAMDRNTFVTQCRRFEAFPTDVLDVLEPSPKVLYSPLVDRIASSGGHATFFPMCEMLGADAGFFKEQGKLIGGIVGLDVDPDKVIEVIENGGALPDDLPEGGLRPPG